MKISMLIKSPLGPLQAIADGDELVALHLPDWHDEGLDMGTSKVLKATAKQLDEYFAGKRRDFDLELAPRGTGFQEMVWRALVKIPFGETWSYGELAKTIGRPSASRAVGAANGKNPIAIIVPCHRVIGADGSLTGYGGGLPTKKWLLAHERAQQVLPRMGDTHATC